MKILEGQEKLEALAFMEKAAELAREATCERARCGSVIVKDGKVIGSGYNSPPGNLESQRRCSSPKFLYDQKVTDKTCCIHAEQRAIRDALRNGNDLEGSTLYFMRVDKKGGMTEAGRPYCTSCSKAVLDEGIENFVLWHNDGITAYETQEYNDASFNF